MGCCCSCLEKGGSATTRSSETEMSERNNNGVVGGSKQLCIARTMTQPTISIDPGAAEISGHGLALAGSGIEQDAAYWEWHINQVPEGGARIEFGVAHKKDRNFYNELEPKNEDSPAHNGRSMMKVISVHSDDTVGVAVQQSDLPMVQFLLNGEPLHELAVNRFRGLVYPSIYIPPPSESNKEEEIQIKLVMNENGFRKMSPHARFGPVIVARGLI